MFKNIFKLLTNPAKQELKIRTDLHRAILRREAEMGGSLFGKLQDGQRREFFCLDSHSWVWHEEWEEASGKRHIQTTRYDIRPDGVYKAQEGIGYKKLSLEESKNLLGAIRLYKKHIAEPLYEYTQQTE